MKKWHAKFCGIRIRSFWDILITRFSRNLKKLPHANENIFFEENAGLHTFSDVFSWKRLNMAICKLHILVPKSAKERIETIFESIGQTIQDLADFSFIFWQICIAYISGTNPFKKKSFDKFCGSDNCSKRVKFRKNWPSRSREKAVTERTDGQMSDGQRTEDPRTTMNIQLPLKVNGTN